MLFRQTGSAEIGKRKILYLCDHHVAVKSSLPILGRRSRDMASDLRNDWSSKGNIWDEMPIHCILSVPKLRLYLGIYYVLISTCSQSAPCSMVFEQSAPSAAKSAERMEGAMMAAGDILGALESYQLWVKFGGVQCLE